MKRVRCLPDPGAVHTTTTTSRTTPMSFRSKHHLTQRKERKKAYQVEPFHRGKCDSEVPPDVACLRVEPQGLL